MTTGIQINKLFKRWLQNDSRLTEIVSPDNMKPLVLSPTSYPFISWTHDTIVPETTKDGQIVDGVDELIAVVSQDYEESVRILEIIREKLEGKKYEDDDIYIDNIEVTAIDENFIKDAFV